MLRIPVEDDAYLIARAPADTAPEAVESAIRAAVAAAATPPMVLAWDAAAPSPEGPGRLRFGEGGLDDLMLAQFDMTGCCAVLESVHRRLKGGSAPNAAELVQIARDPRLTFGRVEGLAGEVDFDRPVSGVRKIRAAAHPDKMSIVILAHGGSDGVEHFIHTLANQHLTSRTEILVIAASWAREESLALPGNLDNLAPEHPMRIRRFFLPGRMSEAMAVNTGLTLATGQVAVIARPECALEADDTIQSLANWAAGADVFSASPRVMDGENRLLAAGLYAEPGQDGGLLLRPWTDRALSGVVRRVAAPAPWFFAVNRAAWLEHGGANANEPQWTVGLARTGKHLLVGTTGVVWTGARRPVAAQRQVAVSGLSPDASRAMAWGGRARAADAPAQKAAPTLPAHPAVQGQARAVATGAATAFGFSDALPSTAPTRLLILADGFGASQALAFVDGLGQARSQGQAAVRIVTERGLEQDGGAETGELAAAIDRHFAETSPTALVLSRFGHEAAARLAIAAARSRGVAVVVHLDDDLFDLPPVIGIERYRLSRNPARMQALHRSLAEADLVLTSTSALADKLSRLAGHDRVGWMEIGSAGRPGRRGPARASDQSLVIGYMGSASHNHDLELVVPALNAVLERFDHVSVELFGSISQQPAADMLRGRVRKHRPVAGDYQDFKAHLAGLSWDIGLAPLRSIAYNGFKTPTKWVEYAEAGIAAIVSDSEVYQPMIRADAALAAGPDQWESALRRLIEQPQLRADVVSAADQLLRSSYGWDRLEASVLGLLRRAERPTFAA